MQAHPTTPVTISQAIRNLCRELVPNIHPNFVTVTPQNEAEVNDCFPIIERHAREHGGAICYGWTIWEWPDVMVEAEFHAVWKDPAGKLHDLTPKPHPVSRILFLSDAARTYDGRQVNNVRRALSNKREVHAFIKAADDEFEFLNRGARAEQHGPMVFEGNEAKELSEIQQRKAEAQQAIVAGLERRLGRNDPCPCGSGRKYKKCCGG